jgi:hypothetical protein
MSLDSFWAAIEQQLAAAQSARSAADVLRIFASPGHNSPGFFGGSGGDDALDDALYAAGWTYAWSEASYHWAMRAPDGSGITYVEGDIFGEIERPPHRYLDNGEES